MKTIVVFTLVVGVARTKVEFISPGKLDFHLFLLRWLFYKFLKSLIFRTKTTDS
jgi:hypothetical protein